MSACTKSPACVACGYANGCVSISATPRAEPAQPSPAEEVDSSVSSDAFGRSAERNDAGVILPRTTHRTGVQRETNPGRRFAARVRCRETSGGRATDAEVLRPGEPRTRTSTLPFNQDRDLAPDATPDIAACESAPAASSSIGTNAGTGGTIV